jgi:predicted TIM-barrel fold metal-dependent hydrolase
MTDAAIFDIHQHFGSLLGVPGSGGGAAASLELDCRQRLDFMDTHGIGQAALMPGHSYSAPGGIGDIRAINDGLHAYGALAPQRFPALFGTVDPRHGIRHNLAEVERLDSLGFCGLSWHNRFQGLPIDHPVMFEVVDRMDRFGMVALMHCYANGDFEAPWRLLRLADRYPGTSFVALDAMTSPENLEQLLAIAELCGNVFIDLTTTLLGARGILLAIERVGPGRLVFGTNSYSMVQVSRIAALEAIRQARLEEDQQRAILSGNAKRILGV